MTNPETEALSPLYLSRISALSLSSGSSFFPDIRCMLMKKPTYGKIIIGPMKIQFDKAPLVQKLLRRMFRKKYVNNRHAKMKNPHSFIFLKLSVVIIVPYAKKVDNIMGCLFPDRPIMCRALFSYILEHNLLLAE